MVSICSFFVFAIDLMVKAKSVAEPLSSKQISGVGSIPDKLIACFTSFKVTMSLNEMLPVMFASLGADLKTSIGDSESMALFCCT